VNIAVAPDAVSIFGKLAGGDNRRADVVREEFAETIPLGVKVDATKAQAAFKDGELTVVIPKAGRG
jgi:HSP20 family molecular chaperone IbpA